MILYNLHFYTQKREPMMNVRSSNANVVSMGFLVDAPLEKISAVRLDAAELPQSSILRKYVYVVTGVDQLSSEPVIIIRISLK